MSDKLKLETRTCICGCGLTFKCLPTSTAEYYSKGHDPKLMKGTQPFGSNPPGSPKVFRKIHPYRKEGDD